MISNRGKSNRVIMAKMLLDAGFVREKIKGLIKYPKLDSLFITAEANNANFDIILRDSIEEMNGSIQSSRNVSLELNREIREENAAVDPSSKNAEIDISLNQDGSAWDAGDVVLQSKFSDGTENRRMIVPNKAGDGTGNAIDYSIVSEIDSPDGWGKI